MKKADYGIDAPGVIRNLFLFGTVLMFIAAILSTGKFPAITMFKYTFLAPAVCLILAAVFMMLYSKYGKERHRDRMLCMHQWSGEDKVLDVGTGSGLLMIGVAKKLTSGKSYGIDIFNSADLSENSIEHTRYNVRLEEVEDETELRTENILKTNFAGEFFDVVLSNLCLHNIYDTDGRKRACEEIYRILKPGGVAIISDFKYSKAYKKTFESLGMAVTKRGPYLFDTFPPLSIVKAVKPS